jgi:hypothetical protein
LRIKGLMRDRYFRANQCAIFQNDGVDAPECARREVGEPVERSPSRQLAVQVVDHVHRGNIMMPESASTNRRAKVLAFSLGIVETTDMRPLDPRLRMIRCPRNTNRRRRG